MAASTPHPQFLASVPSTESSPPPSPVPLDASASIKQSSGVEFKHRFLPLPFHRPLAASTSDHPNIPAAAPDQSARPRLPGRQETPPSPPNSVLLDQSPTSPSQPTLAQPIADHPSSPQSISGTNVEGPGVTEHQTPPPSLKDRLARAFKGHKRGESDVSMSTNINPRDGASTSNHRHNNSGSTLVTSATTTAQNIRDNNNNSTILQTFASKTNLGFSPTKPDFYTHQWASPIRPNSQNHYTYGHGGTKRRIMNGGEVRVEILPRPSVIAERSTHEEGGKPGLFEEYKEQGGGDAYKSHGVDHVRCDQHEDGYLFEAPNPLRHGGRRSQNDLDDYLPPLNLSLGTMGDSSPRSRTATSLETVLSGDSDSSGGSRERRFVEESTASFNFEDLRAGSENDNYFAGFPSPNPDSGSALTGLCGSSGMASSGVLASLSQGDLSTQARSNSSLGGYTTGKSSSGAVGRSSSSHLLALQRGQVPGSGTSPMEDAVGKELKRLSKISAGSGVSGVAIVVTSDEPDSDFGEGSDDDADDQRWTREEKGKGRAPRSVGSGNGSMAERSGSDARLGNYKEHHRSGSGMSRVSGWSLGDQSGGTGSGSEGGDDDSRELLKGVDQTKKRKLKSQVAPKGVLVHEGDGRYDFVYRMRRTPDETPILVPQYTFSSESSFPNRNALTLPIPAKISSPNLRGADHIPLATRYGSSPITKPEGAVVRSPDLNDSYYGAVIRGGQADDSPAHSARYSGSHKSISQSMSDSQMGELIHPAHRQASRGGRDRGVVSMGSLEGIVGIGLRPMPSPGLSGGKFVGSSLADTSDIGHPLEDTTAKSSINQKRVRMSANLDEIAPAPQHYFEREPEVRKKRRSYLPPALGPRPMRPKDLRRSMTPHLYAPRPLGDSWKDLADIESLPDNEQTLEYRKRERRVGRLLLVFCMLFPPLLLVVAWGGFDVTVEGWTSGQLKGVGRVEKRIAAWVGGTFAVCVVAGIIAGAVVVSI